MRGDRNEDYTMNQFTDEYFYTDYHPTVVKYEPSAEYHHSADNGEYFGQSAAVTADPYYYDATAAAVGYCTGYGPYDTVVTSSSCNNSWSSAQDYCSPGASDGQPYVCGWTPSDTGSHSLQAPLQPPPPSHPAPAAIPELAGFCGSAAGDDRPSVDHQTTFLQTDLHHHGHHGSVQTLADQFFSK